MPKQPDPAFDPGTFLSTAAHGRALKLYAADQTIFSQGEPADAVFYVQKGDVKIVVTSDQGKEAVVGIVRPREFFGEGSLTGQPLRLATATALTDSEILCVEKPEMVRVLHAEPAFAELFIAHLLTRNTRIEADLVD